MGQLGQNIEIKRTKTLTAVAHFPKTVNIVGLLICVICAVYFVSHKWKSCCFVKLGADPLACNFITVESFLLEL
jgi:hypothetical protein